MTSAEAGAAEPDTTAAYRIALLVIVVLASTLYATTVLVVSVILPQMQGSLSATQDQISWVVTLNILATAMLTPMTGWLVARFRSEGHTSELQSLMRISYAVFCLQKKKAK